MSAPKPKDNSNRKADPDDRFVSQERTDRTERTDRADPTARTFSVDPAEDRPNHMPHFSAPATDSPPIRAVHIRSSAGHYGPERSLLEICPALVNIGVDARIVIMYRRPFQGPAEHPLVAAARRRNLRVEQVEDRGPLSVIAVRRAIRATRDADVLHSHCYKSNFVAYLAATRGGHRRPWIATMHLHTGSTRRLRIYRSLDRLLLRRADAVFTVSDEQAAELTRNGIAAARIEIVPTVLDVERYADGAVDRGTARSAIGIAPETPLVVAIGRLTRQKGFDVLIDSAVAIKAAIPGVQIIIAGDGPERRALEAAIAGRGLGDTVRCIGYVDVVSGLLNAADVVVAPSRGEGLPLLLLEALALARPLVATPVGGVPELIEDGVTGRLVPVEDGEGLARAIIDLLRRPAEAARLGAAGRERVRTRHSPAAAAIRMAVRYRALVGGDGAGETI